VLVLLLQVGKGHAVFGHPRIDEQIESFGKRFVANLEPT
jgi:hypothetical protein